MHFVKKNKKTVTLRLYMYFQLENKEFICQQENILKE